VLRRWAGSLITVLILGGVALVLLLNLNLNLSTTPPPRSLSPGTASSPVTVPAVVPTATSESASVSAAPPVGFREYPIGDDVLKNHMRIAAVWLPPIAMEGMPASAAGDVIHLEADIHATEENPNGFAKDEFVPYLKIHYTIAPVGDASAPTYRGELIPMVARDGLHYGASLAMPKAGAFRLTYSLEPPSAGGLGRHSDAATGVAPWWEPFEVAFDWDYPGPPPPQ
jgi:uncharacterized protein involved in high-affinity Fe2+ transport